MEEKMIPYFAHEGDMSRMERANKRLWIVILILIVALVGSNLAWTFYENQFTDEVTTVEQEADWEKGNVIMNGTGGVRINEQSETDSDY